MRRSILSAVLVASAALLTACQDSPVASSEQDLYDLSKVTITAGGDRPNVGAAGRRASIQPFTPCYDPDPCQVEKPLATFDYGPYIEQGYSGSSKQVSLTAWSDNHANIQSMTVTGIFKSVGGSGPQGCNATPAEFARQSVSGPGTPWSTWLSLWVTRTSTYASSGTYVWQVDGQHYFLATSGYSVDGYNRSGTFYSSGRTCF